MPRQERSARRVAGPGLILVAARSSGRRRLCSTGARASSSAAPDRPQAVHFAGPLVVLVDHNTASDGEGVALALRRSGRAIIVGSEGTFGAFGDVGGLIGAPAA